MTFNVCLEMLVQTCSQERIAIEFDSDVLAVDGEKDRWYVKLLSNKDDVSTSPSNDDDSSESERSCASAVGKPAKLPVGILGPKNADTNAKQAEIITELQRLLDNARRQAMSSKAEKEEEEKQVLEHARMFK